MELGRSVLLVLLLVVPSVAFSSRYFGVQGRSGFDGRDGRSGAPGADQTSFVDGSSLSFDLSGSNGSHGTPGQRGGDAYACSQPCPDYDVVGASGGRGGRGGSGGNGGAGGDLRLYYQNLADLGNVSVDASGGSPGGGAWGARGGDPCYCTVPRWTTRRCRDVVQPDGTVVEHCEDIPHRCTPGRHGSDGYSGGSGSRGSAGTLTIINRDTPLEPVQSRRTVAVADLIAANQDLSDNEWERKSGAAALLAPSSLIRDSYYEWVQRHEATIRVDWSAVRDEADFASVPATIYMDEFKAHVSFPSNAWFQHSSEIAGTHTDVSVTAAAFLSDVRNISVQGVSGLGRNLTVTLKDHSGITDVLNTSFSIRYKSRIGLIYLRRYQGGVPASLVEVDGDEFRIRIGGLNIADRFLREGRDIRVTIWSTRRMSGRETVIEQMFEHRI